ncbi:hypothetical protein [Erysipelothrix larvae]|uniref:hypothetical protein n=1 Tax=Erysipelothrix larvae TaxID=1514105 RepID=UPI001E479BC1|nr:hypothetical protein [Erysipelothrix larvae]
MLYAFNRPVFVVDAYLKRILKSLGLFHTDNYDVIQQEMMDFFGHDVTLYQELHACIVEHGKQKTPIDAFDLVGIPNKVYLDVMNREPKFKEIHDTYGYVTRISHPDPYTGFVYTIIGQLLSAASAHAIFTRFIHRFPDVASVNQASLQQVMDLGLTHNKACAIKSLCEKVSGQEFSFEYINTLSDEHAIEALTKLKGLGRWSAIIILIHTYNRLNLTSYDDIALRKSVARILKIESVSKRNSTGIWHVLNPISRCFDFLMETQQIKRLINISLKFFIGYQFNVWMVFKVFLRSLNE